MIATCEYMLVVTHGLVILGNVDAISAPSWDDCGATWVIFGAILGHVGTILGLSWEDLEATWVKLGAILGHVVAILGHLGQCWGHLVAILGGLGGYLGPTLGFIIEQQHQTLEGHA